MMCPDRVFSADISARFFAGINEGIVVECGALNGLWGSVGYVFEERGWTSYNIEPNPHCSKELASNRIMSTNLFYALSNSNGTARFTFDMNDPLNDMAAGGSIVWGADSYMHGRGTETVRQIDVETKTYKSFVKENDIKQIDLFILDVEGSELNVLEGIGDCEVLPTVWVVEDNHIDVDSLWDKLVDMGYESDGRYKNNSYFRKK